MTAQRKIQSGSDKIDAMSEIRPSRSFFLRAIILSLITMFGSSYALAQYAVILSKPVDIRALSGQVKDPAGGEIEGAHIDLLDLQTEKVIASTTTDSKGNFHFDEFGKNSYKLKIFKPGFNILQATIRIRKNAPAFGDFTLPIAA
jgi:Carboxypeptidase regulatory-like domain